MDPSRRELDFQNTYQGTLGPGSPLSPGNFEQDERLRNNSNIGLDKLLVEQRKQRDLATRFLDVWNDNEGPEARLRRLSLMQKVMTTLQIILCCGVFVLAGVNSMEDKTGANVFSNIFCGILGFVSAVIGLYSAVIVSEYTTRLFFVCQMWLLHTITMYFYIGMDSEQQQQDLCTPSRADMSTGTSCTSRLSVNQARVAVSVIAAAIAVATACVALDFNDAINDYDALRPILMQEQTCKMQLNIKHPNHLVYFRPTDRNVQRNWHLEHYRPKTAPDIEREFTSIKP